jgi:hypothetical protein
MKKIRVLKNFVCLRLLLLVSLMSGFSIIHDSKKVTYTQNGWHCLLSLLFNSRTSAKSQIGKSVKIYLKNGASLYL